MAKQIFWVSVLIGSLLLFSIETFGSRKLRSEPSWKTAEKVRHFSKGSHIHSNHAKKQISAEDLREKYKEFEPNEHDIHHLVRSSDYKKLPQYDVKTASYLFYRKQYPLAEAILLGHSEVLSEFTWLTSTNHITESFHYYLKNVIYSYRKENEFDYVRAVKDIEIIDRAILWSYTLLLPKFYLNSKVREDLIKNPSNRYSQISGDHKKIVVRLSSNHRFDETILNHVWKLFFLPSFSTIDRSKIHVVNIFKEPVGDSFQSKIDAYLKNKSPRTPDQKNAIRYLTDLLYGRMSMNEEHLAIKLSKLKGENVFIVGHIPSGADNPSFVIRSEAGTVDVNIKSLAKSFHKAGVNFFPLGCSSCKHHSVGLDRPINNVDLMSKFYSFLIKNESFKVSDLLNEISPAESKFVIDPLALAEFHPVYPRFERSLFPVALKSNTSQVEFGYVGMFSEASVEQTSPLPNSSPVALALERVKLPVFSQPCIFIESHSRPTFPSLISIGISFFVLMVLLLFCQYHKKISPMKECGTYLPIGTPDDYIRHILRSVIFILILSFVISLFLKWLIFEIFYLEEIFAMIFSLIMINLVISGKQSDTVSTKLDDGCIAYDTKIGFNSITDRESEILKRFLYLATFFAIVGVFWESYDIEVIDICKEFGASDYSQELDFFLNGENLFQTYSRLGINPEHFSRLGKQ